MLRSGSVFPIGVNTVSCNAVDSSGKRSTARFDVRVKDARDQLDDLIALIISWRIGLGTSLIDKVASAQALIAGGRSGEACETLGAFVRQVSAQTGKKLTVDQAQALTTAVTRIKVVTGC